jgi:FkbM family methyltransferase
LGISADFASTIALLQEFAWLSCMQYTKGVKKRPFSCRVQINGRSASMRFTGTMSELLTLVDIFVDGNYVPKLNHMETLFPAGIRTFLDLGANIGIASVWLALMHPDAVIHAYEPSPEIFILLEKNLAQFPNARAIEQAIAGKEGLVTFNQSLYSLESSMFSARSSAPVQVQATTIDEAMELIGNSVDFMKIDIEGAEFEAFKSSKKLGQIRAITGEAHTEQSGHAEEELPVLLSSFDLVQVFNPNKDTVFGFYAAHTIA